MNRKKRVQMIVRTLLAPFTQPPFDYPDPWEEKAAAFRKMQYDDADSDFLADKRSYQHKRQRLIRTLEQRISPDRVSELEQLVDMFYPDEEMIEYLLRQNGHAALRQDAACLDGFYFEKLQQIAVEFITLRDGKVSLRMWDQRDDEGLFRGQSGLFKVELWSELSRTITPDVLIAAYFCACGIEDFRQLAGLPDTIFLSDTLLSRIQQQGIAETHMHFSAGMSYLSVWEAVTDLMALCMVPAERKSVFQQQQQLEFQESHILLVAGYLRLMLAKYLEDTEDADSGDDIYGYFDKLCAGGGRAARKKREADGLPEEADMPEQHILRHVLRETAQDGAIEHLTASIMRKSAEWLRRLREVYGLKDTSALDILLRGPYQKYACLHTAPEIILLHASLCHIRRHPEHRQFTRAVLCYLRIKNYYFSDKLQACGLNGLTFFRRYFSKATNTLATRRDMDWRQRGILYCAAFRNQIRCRHVKKLEIKIAPNIPSDWRKGLPFTKNEADSRQDRSVIAEQLDSIFDSYLTVCDEQGSLDQIPTLGIIYHFIKEDIRYVPSHRCWIEDAPMDYITMIRNQGYRFISALNYLLQHVEHLSNYVVGLDAASEEIYAEPWIYAPVFRRARSRHNTLPIHPGTGEVMQNIGLTYHVGEDYHHLLSGLRHIDEVLTYFGYKAGDRIGHGLALQIDVEEWLRNNEVVAVPIMEHLENLLWLWSRCGERKDEMGVYLPQLEKEIMSLAQRIYQNIRGISPYVLWKAYTRKFEPLESDFCRSMQTMYLQKPDPGRPPAEMPDSQRGFCIRYRQPVQTGNGTAADTVWDVDKLLLTHYCPIYLRCYQKQILVANPVSYREVFQEIQTHMREKVKNAGIYVETNPTSNMTIGDVSSLSEYRITALNDRGLSMDDPMSILISINSDNPLIFNTNVENELAIIYHTLLYRGFGHEAAAEWINKVRENGLNSSFIRKYRPRDIQIQELKSMSQALKQFYRPHKRSS